MQVDVVNNNNPGGSKLALNDRFTRIQGVNKKFLMRKYM